MKSFFRKIHLWLSLPFGIFFSIICLTGATLVFENEVTQMVRPATAQVQTEQEVKSAGNEHRRQHDSNGVQDNGRQGPKHGIEKQQHHQRPPRLPFFQEVRKLHRWLLDAPAKRGETSVGKIIVGISTIMMVIVLVSGVIIWIPKTRQQLTQRLKISVSKGWRRFIHDSHASAGIYVTLFLLLMALTGLTWSFGWYRELVYGMLDNLMETSELRRLFYSLHTGSWGGLTTKVIYFISALAGAFLPWTGYYLWYKKHTAHHNAQQHR